MLSHIYHLGLIFLCSLVLFSFSFSLFQFNHRFVLHESVPTVNFDHFQILRAIGKGSFGKVSELWIVYIPFNTLRFLHHCYFIFFLGESHRIIDASWPIYKKNFYKKLVEALSRMMMMMMMRGMHFKCRTCFFLVIISVKSIHNNQTNVS